MLCQRTLKCHPNSILIIDIFDNPCEFLNTLLEDMSEKKNNNKKQTNKTKNSGSDLTSQWV